MVQHIAIFTMSYQYKVVCSLSNGASFNDLEQPLTQDIFQDLEHGGVSTNPWGSLPFPPPSPLKPGGVVRKLGGGINPLRVWETPCTNPFFKFTLFFDPEYLING